MTEPIYNAFQHGNFDVVELIDRKRIEFYVKNMADQINGFRGKHGGTSSHVRDLKDFIADIIIETSVQGASFLEVHVIDPAWTLFRRDANGNCFIDADEQGYLWPPIEVEFPPNVTESRWRLCQVRPSTDLSAPNVILTFEDVIAARLRETSRQQISQPNQTRADFILSLISQANQAPEYPGQPPIRFVPLLETGALTIATPPAAPPKSQRKGAPPARQNHQKPAGLTNIVGAALIGAAKGSTVQAVEISIAEGWKSFAHSLGTAFQPPPSNFPGGLPYPPAGP